MRCSYGLTAIPGTDARLFSPETSFLQLRRTFQPTRIKFGSFKIKAKIDEARKEMSFYELLGISETGTSLEIKQAYKQLARKYHPDVSPPDRVEEYTERFIRVQEAYETLSDPRTRALYDKDLALGIHLAFSARRRYQDDESKLLVRLPFISYLEFSYALQYDETAFASSLVFANVND
ncbi:hypothetical protein Gotur_007835, partial [Gossypium turneri]